MIRGIAQLFLLPVLLLGPVSAQTKDLVLNGSFEVDDIFCSPGVNCYLSGISGWIAGPSTVLYKPGPAEFPGGVPDGSNVAAIGNESATGSISQSLGITVQPNKTYILTLSIGQRLDFPFANYAAAITAGGETLASDSSIKPAPGTFANDVIVYRSGVNPPLLGYPIGVLIKSFAPAVGGGKVDVDRVSMTVK